MLAKIEHLAFKNQAGRSKPRSIPKLQDLFAVSLRNFCQKAKQYVDNSNSASSVTKIYESLRPQVDVHGMTCALCVDTLNRKFNKMEGVTRVEVSMKIKKVRLEVDSKSPTIEMIKQTILDAGFTPVKITVLADEDTKVQQ